MELQEQQSVQTESTPSRAPKEVLEWLETVVSAVVIVVLMFTFLFRMVGISGDSMMQTLHNGERVILMSAGYTPDNGDIVVISRDYMVGDKEPIIKRIIATEGQEVYLDHENNLVYVDGVALDEPYIFFENDPLNSNIIGQNPHTVPAGHVFVMGDHRDNSLDSRMLGDIDQRYILGRAVLRVFPFDKMAVLTK